MSLVEAAMNLARAYDDPRPNVQAIRAAERSACEVGGSDDDLYGLFDDDDEIIDWMLAFGRQCCLGERKEAS